MLKLDLPDGNRVEILFSHYVNGTGENVCQRKRCTFCTLILEYPEEVNADSQKFRAYHISPPNKFNRNKARKNALSKVLGYVFSKEDRKRVWDEYFRVRGGY